VSTLAAFLMVGRPSAWSLHLVLPPSEVYKLMGVDRELAYVRDNQVNVNAAKFVLPVPESVNAIQFVWWSGDGGGGSEVVHYRILINSHSASGDPEEASAMYQPHLNISHAGRVPREREIFRISLPCTGRLSAIVQIDLTLQFNVTRSDGAAADSFDVHLTRQKTCSADSGKSHASTDGVRGGGGAAGGNDSSSSSSVQPHVVFFASLLSALAAMVCTMIGIVIVHVKGGLHKILKTSGVVTSGSGLAAFNKNKSTFNTIVSKSNTAAAANLHSYEPVFQQQQHPLGYNEGLLTMDLRDPLPPPPDDPPPPPPPLGGGGGPPTTAHHPPLHAQPPPPSLVQQPRQKFDFATTGFTSDAESRVTDWVNQQQQQGIFTDGGGGGVGNPRPDSAVQEDEEEDELLIAESIFQSLQVERHRLKLGSLLQEGTFGRVYQGLFQVRKAEDDDDDDEDDGDEQDADEEESVTEVNSSSSSNSSSSETDDEAAVAAKKEAKKKRRRKKKRKSEKEKFVEEDIMVKTVLSGSSQTQSQLLVQASVRLLWNRKSSLSSASRSNGGGGGALPPGGNKHILTPIAGTWDGTSPMVIYPHPSHGNLKQYLTKFASAGLSTHHVVRLGVQMLSALAHLHKKKIIHKDVATRNCFLGDGQTLLLGDASLSRDLFPADYHCLGDNENRPIKWMPIETISSKNFSKASDVWSFGVFLWELMTKAQQPFADIDPFEMESYLNEGYRLHQPMNCPDQLYSVLAACWATLPQERANVQSLHSTLQWMQKQLQQFV